MKQSYKISLILISAVVCSWLLVSYKFQCCIEDRTECLACQEGLSVEVYCIKHVNAYYCQPLGDEEAVKSKDRMVGTEQPLGDEEAVKFKDRMVDTENPKNSLRKADDDVSVMIAVEMIPGNGYDEFASRVMKQYHGIDEKNVYLFSVKSDNMAETTTWRKWYGDEVHILSPNVRETWDMVLVKRFLDLEYTTLLLIRSDMVFLSGWRKFLTDNLPLTDGALSLYRVSEMHNWTVANDKAWVDYVCERPNGEICERYAFGNHGIAMTRKLAKSLLVKDNSNKQLGKSLKNRLKSMGIRLFYPVKSAAMFISQYDQDADHCGKNEVPHRFQRCVLPAWIQNGVEFYFDRCTDPDERFPEEYKEFQQNISNRLWARPAVSFSLYGSARRYNYFAMVNANRMGSVYPEWKMWVYHNDTVPKSLISDLCEFNVHLIDMTGSVFKNGRSWRFLVASEPVKMYAVRDIDSRILLRGKAAVDEWKQSGTKFHLMRDKIYHSKYPINAGMWGGTHDAIPEMKELMMKARIESKYIDDTTFLTNFVWPIAKERTFLAHDSNSSSRWGEIHPFPVEMEDPRFYVGKIN